MFGVDDIIGGVLKAAGPVLEHFFPDPQKRYEFELAMRQIDLSLMQGQMAINQVEAASSSLFIAGWRPFIGWVGGIALAWQFLLAPIFASAITLVTSGRISLPIAAAPELLTLVVALLGLGTLRSYEKIQGVLK